MKKKLTGLLCSGAAMFVWIFIAMALTGGRDVGEFTDTDKIVMTVFLVVEIATVIVMLLFAALVGREYGKKVRQQAYKAETKWEKKIQRRGMMLYILPFMIALGVMIGGIVLGKQQSLQLEKVSQWGLGISCAAAVIALLFNIVLRKWYVGRFEKQQVRQVQQFVYSHREQAEKTAARKLSFLRKWRLATAAYSLLLGMLGLCIALCAGILNIGGGTTTLCFAAALLLSCAFSRIRFTPSQDVFDEDKAYVTQEQYPYVYAVAQKAAQTLGCSGKIKIAFFPDCNAGIAKVGQTYSVQLGVILLCTLSEEELYSVLLHEFAHMASHNREAINEGHYNAWLNSGKNPHFFSGITERFFGFFDAVYTLQYSLYSYASSIQTETAADQAMLLGGNPAAVASALVKIKFYDLFEWEKGTRDEPSLYESETPDKQVITKELHRFQEAMSHRSQHWKQLMDVEIQSRAASHPTLRLRLEALGIREAELIPAAEASHYTAECEKALEYVNERLCENIADSYDERRKVFYLDPKSQVEDWESAGKPLIAQEYGDIIWALRQLGRNEEAFELCERAIEELSNAASCDGYFIRGCCRLHSYDAAGLGDIYHAMENNKNYLEEGLNVIGAFCCLTGNREELDIYREKAITLAQKHKDQYSQVGVLNKNDRLSAEQLPEGMLEDILGYIRSMDDGQIEKVYLVRKTITEDFFSSVFVIRFTSTAEEEVCSQIMHKIFRYLDTCSNWQFSLFDYQEVQNVPVSKIENSCVYSKEE